MSQNLRRVSRSSSR